VTVARGASRSRPATEILTEVRQVEAAGYREIILTGVNLGVFRDERVDGLTGLARLLLENTGIERIRFSSIEPQDFPEGLDDLWPNPRLCRHFHLPLQSGCDRTLARMRRKYRLADYNQLLERLLKRIPDLAVTTDVIVGFPGETEEDFAESRANLAALPFSDLHVFPFSSRPGTAAASMPHPVPPPVRRERCEQMHRLSSSLGRTFRRRFLGRELKVLWDGKHPLGWSGLSDNYLRVVAASETNRIGEITRTGILDLEEHTLRGEIVAELAPGCGQVRSVELVKSSIL
jgi:threonylcarbamoyladenosine tRNA methylthiotransferase MtaB